MSKLSSNTVSLQTILETINNLPEGGTTSLQDKTVTPTTNIQIVTADSAYDGLDTVTVEAIPSDYIVTTDATAEAGEIMEGETAYVNGDKVTGTFTIDSELTTQDDLIVQIQTALAGKAVGSTVVDDVSMAIITRTITEIEDDSLETIGDCAFIYCESLTTVSFPACTNIGYEAFRYCTSLTTISFPACTSIGSYAFAPCWGLTSANFPACTSISTHAFYSCTSLTTVNFPVCTSIGSYAFGGCSKLTTVSFPACTSISEYAFTYCSSLTTVSFPACTNIGYDAFRCCFNLTSANFPVCISVGADAFFHCHVLSSIQFGASSVCTLAYSDVFSSTPFAGYSSYFSGTPHIYVPGSLITAYQSATNWVYFSSYFSSIESLLITFDLCGEQQAEQGMTFGEWVESAYNVDGFTIAGSGYLCDSDGYYVMTSGEADLEYVMSSTYIVANAYYDVEDDIRV